MNILKKVFLTIDGYDLIRKGETILCAVSGGPDSVALLTILKAINELQLLEWKLHVAHFNHGLREKAADDDEDFVRRLAEKHGLPFHSARASVRELQKTLKLSPEEAARKARYQWLTAKAIELHAQKIAIAHNLDDQAETILHRIIRGTGLRGLRGMSPIRRISKKHDLYAVRPLIEVERVEIESFLREQSLAFQVDASNTDISLTRNRLRHKLIPLIENEFNPRVKMALVKLGQTAGSFYLLLREIAEEVYENTKMLSGEREVCLSVEEFSKLPPAIQTLIIDKAVRTVRGAPLHLNFEHYLEIISLCGEHAYSKTIRLPKGLEARRESYILKIWLPKEEPPLPKFGSKRIKVPGTTLIKKLNIKIDAEIMEGKVVGLKEYIRNKDFTEEILDLEKIHGPLVVRLRRRGDTFNPLGARGSTKLKKFFIENKIPKTIRDRVPLVSDTDRILWVVGYRLANEVRITDDTLKVLKLKVSRIGEEGT
ncbi:MAG: tRNA lysidine(34) synthetase TilS [Planctomycetes bacterium]|nr:tRNA lysidine(34) synthetase TilS [Planctomycetota bacterium]